MHILHLLGHEINSLVAEKSAYNIHDFIQALMETILNEYFSTYVFVMYIFMMTKRKFINNILNDLRIWSIALLASLNKICDIYM